MPRGVKGAATLSHVGHVNSVSNPVSHITRCLLCGRWLGYEWSIQKESGDLWEANRNAIGIKKRNMVVFNLANNDGNIDGFMSVTSSRWNGIYTPGNIHSVIIVKLI